MELSWLVALVTPPLIVAQRGGPGNLRSLDASRVSRSELLGGGEGMAECYLPAFFAAFSTQSPKLSYPLSSAQS